MVALGAASTEVTRQFGYAPPLFGKRGYHMHYTLRQRPAEPPWSFRHGLRAHTDAAGDTPDDRR